MVALTHLDDVYAGLPSAHSFFGMEGLYAHAQDLSPPHDLYTARFFNNVRHHAQETSFAV